MQPTPDATASVATFTTAQRNATLIEHTADLDKADVLRDTLPQWLTNADVPTAKALKTAFTQSGLSHTKALKVLEKLKPLDVYCKEELTRFLKGKWTIDFDVERDTLEIVTKNIASALFPFGYETSETVTSRSLLQAAMENFTLAQTQAGGIPEHSFLRINSVSQRGTANTPASFAALCRELDLGAGYQRHLAEALALPTKPVTTPAEDDPASVTDIRRLKLLELTVAVHIACLKKDISPAVSAALLSVIEQDVSAAKTSKALFDGAPIIWQGLMIHDACICGALVFSKVSIDTELSARCVVYLPNDPDRPLYEYASLDAFKDYLSLKLQIKNYRDYFTRQFLPGHDKSDFFTAFDEDQKLGTLTATPADCLSDFFFGAFVSKAQRDAGILAVSTAEVDEEQREKTLQLLLDGGLLLLNAASFFVPVLGELMLCAAAVDIASEVYEGVQDWTHGERNKALSHLLTVVENVAQMAAFAVGGKVVSAAFSRGVKEQAAFFDDFEAVTRADGQRRLWKPDLAPYQQVLPMPETMQVDAKGLYKQGEHTSIKMDEAVYRVSHNSELKRWQIKHCLRQEAYMPSLERNAEGGWRHIHEHAHEWPDSGYALKRAAPRLQAFSQRQLTQMADITGLSKAELFRLHDSQLSLPARLNDCIERFRFNARISELIKAMEAGETANTEFVQEQLHTLPRLPGWPAKRFIEVHDEEGDAVSRFPENSPANDEVNSVLVSQKQLEAGQLLDTVMGGLYSKEVEAIIGATTTESKAQLLANRIATALKSDRRPLHEWLYKTYDGEASAEVATLREQAADLPTRVAEDLLKQASQRDRLFLQDRKIVGLELAQRAREAQSAITLDRALTGLHLPKLANADTETLTLRLMNRVRGWDDEFRLELRQNSPSGTLLGSVGKADAPSVGMIVKTADGYQVTHQNGTLLTTKTSSSLVDSILHALPGSQRARMGLSGDDQFDAIFLREHLATAATADPARTALLLSGEHSEAPAHLSGCTQADPAAPNIYPKALIRKVRKLYPQFSDAEVSSFLDTAGNSHQTRVDRIKTLEQQWKKLRGVLHTWRDDQTQMKKLPGKLADVRVSRRQVVTAIENCWRRVELTDQPSSTLKLERNPSGPLPTMSEADVAHVRALCVKEMQAGDELDSFLKPFKGLVRLELDGNQLTRLPEALSLMSDLEHLSLNRNTLALTEESLRKLADMRKLKTLGLTGNRLGATVDVSKMPNLQSLFLGDTHATELPEGLSRLPYLDIVDLRGNDIQELPAWLFDVPRRFARRINLRHNPLSPASSAKLKAYRDENGVGMGFLEDDVAVINEQKARDLWMPDSREPQYAKRNRTWTALKNEPESDGFFRLLAEVGDTADNRFVHEDMTQRVWNVIEAFQGDSVLREQLLPMAVKGNCDDSAAALFSHIEVAVDIDKLVRESANQHDRAARLLTLARSLFRQDYLAKLAREHVKGTKLDLVEVELAYRTGLAERLSLIGQPTHMRFANLSGVTATDLDTAYNKVITAELTSDLATDISARDFWGSFLREHHAQQFTDLTAPFHARIDAADETREALGDGYQAHVDGIASEKEQAENGLLKRLTEEAMKADELKLCFKLG